MTPIDILKEKWDQVRAAIKARWGDQITDRDLDQVAYQHDQICHLIGEKCGVSERRARAEFNKILDGISLGGHV